MEIGSDNYCYKDYSFISLFFKMFIHRASSVGNDEKRPLTWEKRNREKKWKRMNYKVIQSTEISKTMNHFLSLVKKLYVRIIRSCQSKKSAKSKRYYALTSPILSPALNQSSVSPMFDDGREMDFVTGTKRTQ